MSGWISSKDHCTQHLNQARTLTQGACSFFLYSSKLIVALSSPDPGAKSVPPIGEAQSQPLGCQGGPKLLSFKIKKLQFFLKFVYFEYFLSVSTLPFLYFH